MSSENLGTLMEKVQGVVQDAAFSGNNLINRINDAITDIAGGVRMPDGGTSPPLPDLYASAIVATTSLAYASLPDNYQRNVFHVYDSSGFQINPPHGGGYYSFKLFLRQASNKSLTEAGSVTTVCVNGRKLYYQGIPSTPADLGVHYYRKPVPMATNGDEPDGIPEHLQLRLIKHYVCKEIFGEALEDGQDNAGIGTKYHTAKFFEAMTDLIDFIGIDGGPQYYGSGDFEDLGACD